MDDTDAFKAFVTKLQQYDVAEQNAAVADGDDKVTYGVNAMYNSKRRGSVTGVHTSMGASLK